MSFTRSHRLTGDHDLSRFDCGDEDLNDWLRRCALDLDARNVTRTYVFVPDGRSQVCGYFSLMPDRIAASDLSSGLAGGVDAVPAILVAKLALDRSLHGRGHGGDLVVEAVRWALAGIEAVGGRLIVVDAARQDLVAFYQQYGFRQLGSSLRLGLKASSAARSVGMPDPS